MKEISEGAKAKTIDDFDSCPHCGSTHGYYTRVFIKGWIRDATLFNGEKYNYEMYDHLSWGRETKYYLCYECDKRIVKK